MFSDVLLRVAPCEGGLREIKKPHGEKLTPAVQDGSGYTGHVQDAEKGLVYMLQRYYEPQL